MNFKLKRLSPTDITNLEELIAGLEDNHGGADLCEGLRNIMRDNTISFETFYLLCKRCNTGGVHEAGTTVSHNISILLFDQILPRLSDSEFTDIEICMV